MPLIITSRDLDCELSFARSSGPGGQNVNKVNSKAVLKYDAINCTKLPAYIKARFLDLFATRITNDGCIVISCDESRDQAQNIETCYDKLQVMLKQAATKPKARVATKPSRRAKAARMDDKKIRSGHKKTRQKVRHTGD